MTAGIKAPQAAGLHRVGALVDCYGIDPPDGRRHRAAYQCTFLTADAEVEVVSGVLVRLRAV